MRNLDKRVCSTYYTPTNGSLGQYLDDISKYKVLSDADIKILLVKAKKGDKKSMDKIVNSNQRFLFSLAKRFSGGNNELLSDLINEANIGLINAINYFDIKNENTFLTYAVYWMQRQIFLYLTFTDPMIKISNKSKTTKVSEIKNKFLLVNGRYPTSDEILDELQNSYGIKLNNRSDIYQISTTSIDAPSITENYDDFSSYASSNETENEIYSVVSNNEYEKNTEKDYSKTLISNSIGVLSDKERKVVEMLYGIDSYREYEIQEVAEKLGITKEGVRLINKRALEKLKDEIIVKQSII